MWRCKIRPVPVVSGAEEDENGLPVDQGRLGTTTEELEGHEEDAGRHEDGRGDLASMAEAAALEGPGSDEARQQRRRAELQKMARRWRRLLL